MTCQIELINAGGAYPRSCPTCQLGPCKKGLPHPFAPKTTDTKVQTPRVDVWEFSANDARNIMCVRAEEARTLERELTARTAELEEAREVVTRLGEQAARLTEAYDARGVELEEARKRIGELEHTNKFLVKHEYDQIDKIDRLSRQVANLEARIAADVDNLGN